MDFTELIDLAAERLGGFVLMANDEFFAPKENLIKSSKPVFIEDKYTDQGKWMDGWETRRRRSPGHDWCIIRLGLPGTIRGALVDTSHFKGNYPEYCSIEACEVRVGQAFLPVAEAEQLTHESMPWTEVLPKSELKGDSQNLFPIQNPHRFTHIHFKIFPDGGVARLRVYGEVVPDWSQLSRDDSEIDLAAVENGGLVVACSDMFFGSRHNLIMPGRALNMSDGWETRRRRGPGHDWVIIKLGTPGIIHRVEVDTSHFKGNFPESCSLEACDVAGTSDDRQECLSYSWEEVLPRTRLQAHSRHFFEKEVKEIGPVTHVRFNIFPDGGVSRLRVYGSIRRTGIPARQSRSGMLIEGIQRLNTLSQEEAQRQLFECCGSTNWALRMTEKRPFHELQELLEAGDRVWWGLERQDWLEAFRQHPKIGEGRTGIFAYNGQADRQECLSYGWSEEEQSGTAGASQATKAALREANHEYERRFGYIFIVCATGKSSEEMLSLLKERLQNDLDTELRTAAEEQRLITHLRLKKLLEQ